MGAPNELPIACSLSSSERDRRERDIADLMGRALIHRSRSADGLLLRFTKSPDTAAAVREMVRRENECCPFLAFSLDERPAELWLTVSAPREAEGLLDGLFTAE